VLSFGTGNIVCVRVNLGGQLWRFRDSNIIDNTTDGTPALVPLK